MGDTARLGVELLWRCFAALCIPIAMERVKTRLLSENGVAEARRRAVVLHAVMSEMRTLSGMFLSAARQHHRMVEEATTDYQAWFRRVFTTPASARER